VGPIGIEIEYVGLVRLSGMEKRGQRG
jgi:hypothetical protein